ncbi:three component ABC system middle component [Bacillus cereus]|uniref:three component ABC system middle component n=1 Tax=Bacillus cereus TaxID=1396 RepID=UPI000BFB849A|nr:three component ABC system middle component [Bacillus cereus]PGR57479.1 hypothetical protein COC49_26960 [Bacillus cereus]
MSILNKELYIVQNPALGSILLYSFVEGYLSEAKKESVPLPLIFIVLPIVFHSETLKFVIPTRSASGLRTLVNKMSDSSASKRDLVFDIHNRTHLMKNITLESLRICIAKKLLEIEIDKGAIKISSTRIKKSKIKNYNPEMFSASRKLGIWCSQLNLQEISMILKVGF